MGEMAIEKVAAQLGVEAEHVYNVLVTQMAIEGWVYAIILPIVTAAIMFATYKLIVYIIRNWNDIDPDVELGVIMFGAVSVLASVVFVISCIVNVPDYILKINNPEYYAIREILEMITGGN